MAVLATAAAPAGAQQGNGAYEPFPSPAAEGVAAEYLALLGVDASGRDLASGRFLDGLAPSRAREAATRSGLGAPGRGEWAALAVGVALAAMAALVLARADRRTARTRIPGEEAEARA